MRDREKLEGECKQCNKAIPKRNTYCDNVCQNRYELEQKFLLIEAEEFDSFKSPLTIHALTKKLLIERYGAKCMECEWNEVNEWTGNVPIELNHVDGNPENMKIENTELLCPSCHSLTKYYGRRGGGRSWRYK